ncbi:MAG: hypothetical protein ACP5JJ_15840 [Anaerolineae bacterium]
MIREKRGWSKPKRLLAGLLAVFLALLVAREYFEPFLTLFINDIIHPKPAPEIIRLTDQTALWLYTDTRPHIGKIDALQKGLVLEHADRRLIEEAYGFGLPLVVAGGAPYNARHAEVLRVADNTLVKRYVIDTADRPVQPLRRKYQPVEPLGTVVVTYTIQPPDLISITADLTGLEVAWDEVYLMNEQGARAFTFFRDPADQTWTTEDMGIWQQTEAPFGCWEAPAHNLRFCVEAPAGQPGFIGRERYNQYNWTGIYYLSWSGIDLEITPPQTTFTYTIRVENLPDAP